MDYPYCPDQLDHRLKSRRLDREKNPRFPKDPSPTQTRVRGNPRHVTGRPESPEQDSRTEVSLRLPNRVEEHLRSMGIEEVRRLGRMKPYYGMVLCGMIPDLPGSLPPAPLP